MTRGRPRAVTPEQIGQAVLEVGFQNLTFHNVARRLQVSNATLFRYAQNRHELVLLGLEAVMADLEWPPLQGPWRQVLFDFAMMAWHTYGKYPGSATETARGVIPPRIMQVTISIADYLYQQGFSADDAVLITDAVFDLVIDNRRGLELLDTPDERGLSPREVFTDIFHTAAQNQQAFPPEIYAAFQRVVQVDPEIWIHKKLELLLNGVAATCNISTPEVPHSNQATTSRAIAELAEKSTNHLEGSAGNPG